MRAPRRADLATALALCLVACQTTAPPPPRPVAVALHPGEEEAGAVVLEEKKRVQLLVQGNRPYAIVSHERRVYIVDQSGFDHANVSILYEPGDRPYGVAARTILPSGEVVEVSPDSISDVGFIRSGGAGARALRQRLIAFPQVRAGSILEHRYSVRYETWPVADSFTASVEIPVRESIYQLQFPRGVRAHTSRRGFPPPTIERWEAGQGDHRESHTWRVENLDLPRDLAFLPPVDHWAPRVSYVIDMAAFRRGRYLFNFSVYPSWKAVADPWWYSAAWVSADPPMAVWPEAAATSPGEQAAAVFAFVQEGMVDRQRVTEEEGEPMTASELFATGFGSANERALVMLSLLRREGIPASLVLLPEEGESELRKEFPNPTAVSVLLISADLDGRAMILDPSCLGCAAGELAIAHHGRIALRAKRGFPRLPTEAGGLQREELMDRSRRVGPLRVSFTTLRQERDFNQVPLREARVALTRRGLVAQRGSWRASGSLAAAIRHEMAWEGALEGAPGSGFRERYLDGLEEGELTYTGLLDPHRPLHVALEDVIIGRVGYVHSAEWSVIPVSVLKPTPWMREFHPDRKLGVYLREPLSFECVTVLKRPEGQHVVSLPESRSVFSLLGRYLLEVDVDAHSVIVDERLEIYEKSIPPEEYADFLEFLGEVRDARSQVVILGPGRERL